MCGVVVARKGKYDMPLLHKKPFKPRPPPKDLKPNEEVFVCPHTKEAFRDYG